MNDDDAAALGWIPEGTDEKGNQLFSLVDEGGDKISFALDPAGQFDPASLRNESQEQRDAEAGAGNPEPEPEQPRSINDDSGAGALEPVSIAPEPAETVTSPDWAQPGSTQIDDPDPIVEEPTIDGPSEQPREDRDETRGDNTDNTDNTDDTDDSGDTIEGGSEPEPAPVVVWDPRTLPGWVAPGSIIAGTGAEPWPPIIPEISPIIAPVSPVIINPEERPGEFFEPVRFPGSVDTPNEPAQTPKNPALPMTAQEFAAQRPDLLNNWNTAHDTNWEDYNSELGVYIRNFGSFEAYLAENYGGAFASPATQPATGGNYSSQFWDDTWRDVGGGRYILVDQGGNVIAFNGDGTGIQNLGPAFARAGDIAANMLQQYNAAHQTTTRPPVVVTPPYVPPVTTEAPRGGGNSGGGGGGGGFTPSPWWDDTHRLIAQTAAGPLYMLIDQGGDVITWIDRGGTITNLSNQGRATANAATTAAQLAAQYRASNPTGGGNTGGGGGTVTNPPRSGGAGGVNLPPGGVSPNFDPTHRFVGYTRDGFEVYRLTDEGGTLVEWYEIPGQGAVGSHYLTGPNDPTSYVYSQSRPTPNTGGGGGGNGGATKAAAPWGTIAIVAGVGGAAWLLASRKKSRR